MRRWQQLGSVLVLGMVLLSATAAAAEDTEHRLRPGVSVAAGLGLEMTYGDYGVSADTTVVTMPVVVALNPLESLDLTLELPVAFLTGKSGSGVVVTQSGSGGRRRGASVPVQTTTTTTTASGAVSEAGVGDISLTAGWTLLQDGEQTPKVRPAAYLKLPTGAKDRGLGTGTFEGGPGLSLSKWLGDLQLFAEGFYILQDSTATYQGKNYVSYSAGGGLQVTDRLFVSLYAKGASAAVEGGTAPLEGRVKLNFLQSRRVAWELYGLAGFTDASPAAGGGLLVMYQF